MQASHTAAHSAMPTTDAGPHCPDAPDTPDAPDAPDTPEAREALACWAGWQALSEALAPWLLAPEGRPGFVEGLSACAAELIALTRRQADVGIFHAVYASPDKTANYSVLHALHTGMLMALIGARKDWGDARTALGVKAALSMNLAITELQTALAQQEGPLDDAQRETIDRHPLASQSLLRTLGVLDEEWLTIVAQHHEQPDGRGYPHGLCHIHPLADALRICDVFGAKLSARVGRSGLLTPRAAAEIFRQRSAGYFGATIIQAVGLYPPGSLVTLQTGELGVVVQRGKDPQAPHVVLLCDSQGQPLSPRRRCPTSQAGGRRIVGAAAEPCWLGLATPEEVLAWM